MNVHNLNETSRTVTMGGVHPPSGSRDAGNKYHPRTEIVHSSIAQIPRFEPLDPAPSGLYRGIMLALPVSLFLWGFIFVAVWRLSSVLF